MMSREDAERVERRLLDYVDNWKFWVGVAYFGIAATIVGLVIVFNKQTKEEAQRAAQQRSSNTTQVSQCFQLAKSAPQIARLLDALSQFATNDRVSANDAIRGAQLGLEQAPDPRLDPVRRDTIRQAYGRLRRAASAAAKVRSFRRLVEKQNPKLPECEKMARMLHVDPKPFR